MATVAAVLTAILMSVSSAGAITWPWEKKPSVQRTVGGFVACEKLLGFDGWDSTPTLLELRPDRNPAVTIAYPKQLSDNGGLMHWDNRAGMYKLRVTIPEDWDKVTVTFNLTCAGSVGSSRSEDKTFDIGRSGDTRNLCNYGGWNSPCNPSLDDQLGRCGLAIATMGVSAVATAALQWLDPPMTNGHINPVSVTGAALGMVGNGTGGVVVACLNRGESPPTIPSVVQRQAPAPTATATVPTIAPIPLTAAPEIEPVPMTTAPPPTAPKPPAPTVAPTAPASSASTATPSTEPATTQPATTQPPTTQPVTQPPAPGMSVVFSENPFRCDGTSHRMGTLTGAQAGERLTFTSPTVSGLLPGTANSSGQLPLIWDCNPNEGGQSWQVIANGAASGRTTTFTVIGIAPTPVTQPPAPGMSVVFSENPFRCDGTSHRMGTLTGAQAGERITFTSPTVSGLLPGTANSSGQLSLVWDCNPNEAGQSWQVTANGAASGRTTTFIVTGR
jgi:hypothetical protein